MKKYASVIIGLLLVLVHTYAEDIEDHKKSGNWRALVEKLSDRNPEARLKAAHCLDEALKLDKNRRALKQAIAPLLKATLNDRDAKVRKQASFALRHTLRNVEDEAVDGTLQSYAGGLRHSDPWVRNFCAHGLNENLNRAKKPATLKGLMGPLINAATQVSDPPISSLDASDMAYFALRQIVDKTSDSNSLRSLVAPMTRALKSKDPKQRRHAAHIAWLFAPKIDDPHALKPLVDQLVAVRYNESDKAVRDTSERTLRVILGPKPKNEAKGGKPQPHRKPQSKKSLQQLKEEPGETEIQKLKKASDFRGLVAKLEDHRAAVRREAAIALPGVVDKIKDPNALKPIIGRLIDVRFRDPWKSTREYTGRALMNVLNKTKDQAVLSNALQPLLDALDQGQVELDRRRYAAVALSVVVMRLERVNHLRPRITDLLSATLKDPDEGVRKYAERALQHTLQKLDHEPTLTIAALPLATQLDSKVLHARNYSAVMLSGLVRKIKDRDTLKSLLGPITVAATKDRDKGVREYADRAMRQIHNALNEKEEAVPRKKDSVTN